MSTSKQTGKRPRCPSSSSEERGDGSQPQAKRTHQALLNYNAINKINKQEIQQVVEDAIRKEIKELRRTNPEHAMPLERTPSRPLERCDSRSLQLHFRTQLSSPLYTWNQIEGVEDSSIHIALIDANTDSVVESGPEASIKLDVVVLEGDFNKENNNDWTRKDFEDHQITRQREGKAPLLVGDLQVTLRRGVGELGKLKFTDNSIWQRSKMFRIGLKVAPGYCKGIRIREAITEALRVKEHRGEPYKQQRPAKPDDEVWRLKNIGRDGGVFHKRLQKQGVVVVEDFLREYVRDGKSLRNVLGMTETQWNGLIDHAKSCVQSGKHYQYSYDEVRSHTVVFDIIGQLKGCTAGGRYDSANSLSDEQKEHLDEMVRKAYNDWEHVKVIKIPSNSMHNPVSDIPPTATSLGQQDYSNQSSHCLTSINTPAPIQHPPDVCASSSNISKWQARSFENGYKRTEVYGSLVNIQNDNISVAPQNPMGMKTLPEVPQQQNLAPTTSHSPSSSFRDVCDVPVCLQNDCNMCCWYHDV